jgi:hypothetical protein
MRFLIARPAWCRTCLRPDLDLTTFGRRCGPSSVELTSHLAGPVDPKVVRMHPTDLDQQVRVADRPVTGLAPVGPSRRGRSGSRR